MEKLLMDAHKKNKRIKATKDELLGLSFVAIPSLGFLLFTIVPMILSAILSFTELKSYNMDAAKFIAFDNYVAVLKDEKFWMACIHTLQYCICIPISLFLGFLLAYFLNQRLPGSRFFRVVFFIPYVCSVVSVSIMWNWVFETNYGIINTFLSNMGLEKIGWLTDEKYFMLTIVLMSVWQGTGYNVILYEAALANVDKSYYEAAEIDGAGVLTKIFKITLPSISPTTLYMLITGIISGLQIFTNIQVMGGDTGGPNGVGMTIVLYLYNQSFTYITSQGVGIANATAWILTFAILILTILNFKLSKKWVHYD